VTLGRALIELGELDEAQAELSRVLESAPENLAAIRGLAEIHHRHGDLVQALAQYRAALLLARNDPDLEETIADLSRQVEPAKPAPSGGLSLQHMQDELLKLAPRKGDGSHLAAAAPSAESAQSGPFGGQVSPEKTPVPISQDLQADTPEAGSHEAEPSPEQSPPSAQSAQRNIFPAISADSAVNVVPPLDGRLPGSADDRATRTVAALEQWLAAIHVSREDRHA